MTDVLCARHQILELKEELQRVSQSSEAAVKLANESAQTQISALR